MSNLVERNRAEFDAIFRRTIALRGRVIYTDRESQRTRVILHGVNDSKLWLIKCRFVNGETVWTAYWGKSIDRIRIFQEVEGGPGIYGTDYGKPYYNVTVIRKILPRLREITVLDNLASIE